MLPAATLPAARYYVAPGRRRRACGRGLPASRREARRRKDPVRDAEAGLAEVMAMPATWKDAEGRLLEFPGAGSGIVACGALPGAAAPEPAWTPELMAAAGVTDEPGPVREGTGLGLASAVITPALIDEVALAGVPTRKARKLTPRLAVQVALARGLVPGTAAATLRALAQRPREADPGYDLPAPSSLSDADSFLQVRPFLRLLAGVCGQIRAAPLPGVTASSLPGPGTPEGDRAAVRLRPLTRPGGPWRDGRWHGLRVLAKDGTVRTVADPKRNDRKGTGGQSRNAAHFGRPASTGAAAAPQVRMVEVTDVWYRSGVAWAAGPLGNGETTLAAHLEPAYGPGDIDLADRGFPSREAAVAKITAGKHFIWRVSSAWKLRRSGRPLPDGTWKAKITWRGRTVKVRVIDYHINQVFDLPPGHPLLSAPPPGASARVLNDGHDGGLCRQPDETIRVEVSETVTLIASLTDAGTYPARDIAELYGMRWASEMVFTQLAKRAVRPVRGDREHVADLDLAVGDDHAVDEQFGELPSLFEGGGGQLGPDGLAECLDPVGDGAEFQPLLGDQRLAGAAEPRVWRGGGPGPGACPGVRSARPPRPGRRPAAVAAGASSWPRARATVCWRACSSWGSQAPPRARPSARAACAGSVSSAHRSAQTSSSSRPAGM